MTVNDDDRIEDVLSWLHDETESGTNPMHARTMALIHDLINQRDQERVRVDELRRRPPRETVVRETRVVTDYRPRLRCPRCGQTPPRWMGGLHFCG